MQRMLVPAARGVIRHAPMAVRLLSMFTPLDNAALLFARTPGSFKKAELT